jgi:hypothetical protein
MVTSVCTVTGAAVMVIPPVVLPAEIRTEFETCAAGLLLVTWKSWSFAEGAAMATTAVEPPLPVMDAGLSEMEAGWPCGVSINCDCTLAPFHPAVMLAGVFAATLLVGIATETVELPVAIVASVGGIAEGELLVRSTTAPPAGAWPFSAMSALACAPPLIVLGESEIDFTDGGNTLICAFAEPELSVAVKVTGVGEVTWPICVWNCIHAVLPGMFTVAGRGNAVRSELVRLMTVPFAGAAPLSCICTNTVLPLKS